MMREKIIKPNVRLNDAIEVVKQGGGSYGTDWNVECICPKCKTKFAFSDGNC